MHTVTTTFEVSDVSRATDPLSEVPYFEAVDSFLHQPLYEQERWQRMMMARR